MVGQKLVLLENLLGPVFRKNFPLENREIFQSIASFDHLYKDLNPKSQVDVCNSLLSQLVLFLLPKQVNNVICSTATSKTFLYQIF
jgi:hypothetical protein